MSTENAKNAPEAEALDQPATIEWRGHRFEVPRAYNDWSIDLLESLEEGKAVGIVRGAIGPENWRIVKAMSLKVRDLNELAELLAAELGFGSAGESPASSD